MVSKVGEYAVGSVFVVARAAMVSELGQDYVFMARAKGLDERRVREMVMLDDQSRIDEAMAELSLPIMTACGEMQGGKV